MGPTGAKGQFVLTVDESGLEARLKRIAVDEANPVTVADLGQLLAEAGIRQGILPDVLAALCTRPADGTPVVVAQGKAPTKGREGWVEYPWNTGGEPTSTPAAALVNDHVVVHLRNVRSGDCLAIVHSPEPGTPGLSVRGTVIAPHASKPALFHGGANTGPSPENPHALVAKADGHVAVHHDGTVEVQTSLKIPGGIDLTTGSIEFLGSLVVHGDVTGGVVVKVKQDLDVHGNLEEATVEAGGNVTLRKGFFGSGNGKVTAGGSVDVQHVMNQTIVAGKDVTIHREMVNGTVIAGGRIHGPGATILGGILQADNEIDVAALGFSDASHPRVRVGKRFRILERISQIDKETKAGEKQLADVKEAVYKLVKLKIDAGKLAPDKEELLAKLQAAQKMIPTRIEGLQSERVQLTAELQKEQDAKVIVRGVVNENVVIEINGSRRMINEPLADAVFVERNGAIELRSE